MLRVIAVEMLEDAGFQLHGMLGGEWVRLLEEHWCAILADLPSATFTVALSDVEFIDQDGERLLRRMADGGVVFVASGCMNRHVIEKLHPGNGATQDTSAPQVSSGTRS